MSLMYLATGKPPYHDLGMERDVQLLFHIGMLDRFNPPEDIDPGLRDLITKYDVLHP